MRFEVREQIKVEKRKWGGISSEDAGGALVHIFERPCVTLIKALSSTSLSASRARPFVACRLSLFSWKRQMTQLGEIG